MRIILFVSVAILAFLLGGWLNDAFRVQHETEQPLVKKGYVLPQPRSLPALELVNENGQVFTEADFKGDWSFIYFGYTYCPDICPMSMAELARMKAALGDDALTIPDQYYLVSVDPRRDAPERLKEYVAYFDPQFKGLTGERPALDTFTRAAGVVYQVPEAPANEDYLVGHSSTITLINPDGAIHAFFTTPLVADDIARDFRAIVANWKRARAQG